MPRVKVIVLRTAGTNCDRETAFAFEKAGATCELVHINKLVASSRKLDKYRILAIPGGFTYGDDISSGKILANEIKYKLKNQVLDFIKKGKLIIGICNGFQVLVKSGLLPDTARNFGDIEASLSINDSGKFEDRWVYLKAGNRQCVWTMGLEGPIYLPVAHAEGKFIPRDKETLERMQKNGQIVFSYCDENGESGKYPHNPNGSVSNIAGICGLQGRILGLMPHPERYIRATQHPRWTRMKKKITTTNGLRIFQNGVKAAANL
ncbi:MAG: phosphoribosylformylglycinamidine synthase I [Omnitrophica bacterium]|nr:phosphoribosylformylglycinamidine synthase I [Candidatus Omnitrophota bacterium]